MISALALTAVLLSTPDCDRTLAAGRYIDASAAPVTRVVYLAHREGVIDFRPSDWTGGLPMVEVARDSFEVPGFTRFGMKAVRDAQGCVRALRTYGFGFAAELVPTSAPPFAIEHIHDGDVDAGTAELAPHLDAATSVALGQILLRFPSKAARAATFLSAAQRLHPESADLYALLGSASVAAGEPQAARAAFRAALRVDSTAEWPASALRMLSSESQLAGLPLAPTRLDTLFAAPTPAELARVERMWNARDLSPRDVAIERTYEMTIGGIEHSVRVIRHTVAGVVHHGVVLVPRGVQGAPILVEAKGVSPSFFPLDVSDLTSTVLLGDDARRVIRVAPSYRGERLIVGVDTFTSGGDRSDVWDGATDDLLTFLNVAKATIAEADTSRVCVFGRSRGGTVGILASLRDRSIDCTVAWAAPTDWFELMGQNGWTLRQTAEESVHLQSSLTGIGGQFLNTFLRRLVAGEETVDAARMRMIASSPLYFAERIGCMQAHWGVEDVIVPVRNGRELAARASRTPCFQAIFHEEAGHDQDRILAPLQSAVFLRRGLGIE